MASRKRISIAFSPSARLLKAYGGPTSSQALDADAITRRSSALCHVRLELAGLVRLRQTIMAMPEMKEWIAAAKKEPEEIDELTWSSDAVSIPGLCFGGV